MHLYSSLCVADPARLCCPQVLASDTLTALCASSSGEDGCAFAEQEEVDVLLAALQSPCASVRETALRVCARRRVTLGRCLSYVMSIGQCPLPSDKAKKQREEVIGWVRVLGLL